LYHGWTWSLLINLANIGVMMRLIRLTCPLARGDPVAILVLNIVQKIGEFITSKRTSSIQNQILGIVTLGKLYCCKHPVVSLELVVLVECIVEQILEREIYERLGKYILYFFSRTL